MKYIFSLFFIFILNNHKHQRIQNIEIYCNIHSGIQEFIDNRNDLSFVLFSTSIYFYEDIGEKLQNVEFVNPNSEEILRKSYRLFVEYLEQNIDDIDSSSYSLYFHLYNNCDFLSRNFKYNQGLDNSLKLLELDSIRRIDINFLNEDAMMQFNQLVDFSIKSELPEIKQGIEVRFDNKSRIVIDGNAFRLEFVYSIDDLNKYCEKEYLDLLNCLSLYNCKKNKCYLII